MAEKIIYLLRNPKVAEKMGKAGRINIEKLNKQHVRVTSIKTLFNDVLKSD